MTTRFSVPALAAIALLLCACPKKGGGADAGAEAGVVTADPAVAVDAGTTTAPTLATANKPVVKHTDAGAGDAGSTSDGGAAAGGDAGATAAGDAGAPQTCCCKVKEAYSSGVTQSSCAGTMGGACVKQEECEKRQCCCDAGGKKSTQMQAECTKTLKGKCVAKDQCK